VPKQKRPPGVSPAPSSALKPADFIEQHSVFRFDEFLEAHAAFGASANTTKALLQYHLKSGRLKRPRRGLYTHDADVDPWLLGSKLSADAVIAYEGAMSFHGVWPLAHSIPFFTQERGRQFAFNDVIYRPTEVPKPFPAESPNGRRTRQSGRD
jgi:hypothetical protein